MTQEQAGEAAELVAFFLKDDREEETAEERTNRFWKGTALESVDTMLAAAEGADADPR